MPIKKSTPVKTRLHPRNKNRERYDMDALISTAPELKDYVTTNKYGIETVDFASPQAVKTLNKAILHHYYGIQHWNFPDENLCPPIPGRADYLHHIADLLAESNLNEIPKGTKITCLDVGLGASCIYPLIGATEYGWNFIGCDTNAESIASSQKIIDANASLVGKIKCRLQPKSKNIFFGVIAKEERVDMTLCNPPFHSSMAEALQGTKRKIKNLSGKSEKNPKLNFSGISEELLYAGGEFQFIKNMIRESEHYAKSCFWFSTLVSKQSNLKRICALLEEGVSTQIRKIPMGTGNKSSRIVAWTFLNKVEQQEWRETRWRGQ